MAKVWLRCRASSSSSVNEPGSSSFPIRSRAVPLPLACCLSTARVDPAWTASSVRWRRSASFPAVVWTSGVARVPTARSDGAVVVGSSCGTSGA